MKKVILKENQVKKLMDNIISEQFSKGERFSQEVRCVFGHHNLKYLDDDIDSISDIKFKVYFTIDVEKTEYGFESMKIKDVVGPEEINVEITVYPEGSDKPETYPSVKLRPQWYTRTRIESGANIGWIGIDDDIEMELTNVDGRLEVIDIVVRSREL